MNSGRPRQRIVEGEMGGFPVPGGWPDRGPFRWLADVLRRRGNRRSAPLAGETSGPAPQADVVGQDRDTET